MCKIVHNVIHRLILFYFCVFTAAVAQAENGYDLWLRYVPVDDDGLRREYAEINCNLYFPVRGEVMQAAHEELTKGIEGLLGYRITPVSNMDNHTLVVTLYDDLPSVIQKDLSAHTGSLGTEGYLLYQANYEGQEVMIITAKREIGLLYGVFAYLKRMQTGQKLRGLKVCDAPKLKYRILNHWDNLNGTVERGYAGYSIWNWERLPVYKEPRYKDYARANASIGINGAVLNNVNAQAVSLRHDWLVKASGLADVL